MIDLQPVMKQLGITHSSAQILLEHARKILIRKFNRDGTLFIKNQPPSKRR